jgi:fructoselysine 6-phosphate deglycase/fructoselysine-6-phosphate deglycase
MRMKGVLIEPPPIATDFVATLEHAVAQLPQAQAIAEEALTRGLRRVYFVGCGGSHFAAIPASYLLEARTRSVSATAMSSAEFANRSVHAMGRDVLVVAASHSGTTPETVSAANAAREAGALVAAITRTGASPLSDVADFVFDYPSDVTVAEPKALHFMQIALAITAACGDLREPTECWDSLRVLPEVLREAKVTVGAVASVIASQWQKAELVYVIGSGATFGTACATAACYLQEMSWMHASAIDGADFFHGPFEVVGDRHVLVLVGEDESRSVGERVASFCKRHYDQVEVLDSRGYPMPGVASGQRGWMTSLVMTALCRRLLDFVAAAGGHDIAARKYMHKVAY